MNAKNLEFKNLRCKTRFLRKKYLYLQKGTNDILEKSKVRIKKEDGMIIFLSSYENLDEDEEMKKKKKRKKKKRIKK